MIKQTKRIGTFPIPAGLIEAILKFTNWDDERSKYYGLESSRSVLLKYNLQYPEGMIPRLNQDSKDLLGLLVPVIDFVQTFYSESYCCKAIITNLPAGGRIESHIDPGWAFTLQKRFHWAIATNSNVSMTVGDTNIHIPVGEIWEINNKEVHGAVNEGKSDRYHFIFDLVIIDEAIAQTPRPFEPNSFDDRLFKLILQKKRKTGQFVVQSLNEKIKNDDN